MARRGSYGRTRTVYRKAKRSYRRASGGAGGFKPIVDGVLAGAGGQVASKYIGAWGQPAAILGVGYFMKNNTLKTIGGMQIGAMLGGMFAGNGGLGGKSQV